MGKGSGGGRRSDWRSREGAYEVNGSDITEMQRRGLIRYSDTEDKYKRSVLAKMNAIELDDELKKAFNEHGVSLYNDKKINLYSSGNAEIEYRGNGMTLQREFTKHGNTLEVHHSLFRLDKSKQGGGLSRKVYRTFMNQYKKMGVNVVSMYANIDVGGYAWARYGFKTSFYQAQRIAKNALRDGKITAAQYNDALSTIKKHSKDGDIRMDKLADKSYGKKMLLGESWDAHIDMSDKRQVKRFYDYLDGRVRTRNDGEKKK